MFGGEAAVAFFIKMLPYMIGMKMVSGVIDILVHSVKTKIK